MILIFFFLKLFFNSLIPLILSFIIAMPLSLIYFSNNLNFVFLYFSKVLWKSRWSLVILVIAAIFIGKFFILFLDIAWLDISNTNSFFFEYESNAYWYKSSISGVVRFVSDIFFKFLKYPRVPRDFTFFPLNLIILLTIQTTDVFPLVPVIPIIFLGGLFFNFNDISIEIWDLF